MNTEEKRKFIREYCNNIDGCVGCPLKDTSHAGCYEEWVDDDVVAVNFLRITGKWHTDIKTIQVKYHEDITKLEKINAGDWVDLRAAEDVEMKAGEFKLISLGVSMKLPRGYEAHVVPRSSTFKNFGIIQTNHMGIIDESYCGDNDVWKFPAYAMRDTVIKKNDRICQFRIVEHMPMVAFVEVSALDSVNRGGFGSTGVE